MSVIAWDGKIIAADKQATNSSMRAKCTKAKRIGDYVYAFAGDLECGLAMIDWHVNGANKEDWPKFQEDPDRWTRLVVADATGCVSYEMVPIAVPVESEFLAWGSGRDFAMGAMGMGATAKEAVEIANMFSTDCGFGVDWFELK